MENDEYGKIAYETYCQHFDGDVVGWEVLEESKKIAWITAADKAIELYCESNDVEM